MYFLLRAGFTDDVDHEMNACGVAQTTFLESGSSMSANELSLGNNTDTQEANEFKGH